MDSSESTERPSVKLGSQPPSSEIISAERIASDETERSIAIATSDETLRSSMEHTLARAGYVVQGPEAIELAPSIVIDLAGPLATAVAELRARARIDAAIAVIARTADASVVDAHRAGAHACLRVPVSMHELVAAIDSIFREHSIAPKPDPAGRPAEPSFGRVSAGLSHELGTPLAVLSMNLDVVMTECERLATGEQLLRAIVQAPPGDRDGRIDDARRNLDEAPAPNELFDALADARASLDRMRSLLSTIKELAGRPARTLAGVDLAVAVEDACRQASVVLEGVTLERMIDVPAWGMANATLLEQVLTELLSNAAIAAKSLSSPRVRCRIYATKDEAIVSVRDNGPGVDPEVHEKIFEPFYTTRRAQGRVGMGLALCREYSHQMGGRITMWSVPGRGACFRLHLHRAL